MYRNIVTGNGYKVYTPNRICSRTKFYRYWEVHHSNVVVRKPSKDICGTCFKFSLLYCQRIELIRKNNTERYRNNIFYSDDSNDEFNKDNNGPSCIPCLSLEEIDDEFLKASKHVSEAKSMRQYFKIVEQEAKENAPGKVDVEKVCVCIIIDYAQNLEMPSYRSSQPVCIQYHPN